MKLQKQFVRDGETVAVSAEHVRDDRWRVRVGDRVYDVDALPVGEGGVRIVPVGDEYERSFVAHGAAAGTDYMVRAHGRTHTLSAPEGRRGGGAGGADGKVRAPMTGTVLDVLCKAGDTVAANQPIVVLSAMKMEHKLTAGVDGVVESISAQKGGTVDQGAVLAVVKPAQKEDS
ncbi:MAG: biotin/lipoyl-binding protein [Planctomycetes bacterium]|nr:biotin/lipoyl-binding protein [Planctomycetota bacterium]